MMLPAWPRKSAAGSGGGKGGGGDDGDGGDDREVEVLIRQVAKTLVILDEHAGGGHNGHTIEKHVKKENDWLSNRQKTERTGSTSFYTKEIANTCVSQIIFHYRKEIAAWISRGQKQQVHFELSFSTMVGYGLNENGQYVSEINKVRIVLVKTENFYRVVTSFPLAPNA